jgi:iron(III) transport system substrate-binding protein
LTRRLAAAAFAVLAMSVPGAGAQTTAAIALEDKPGRVQRILADAKKEGTVNFYTSIPEKDAAVLTADFEKRYGVKASVWRASSVKALQRITTEARAGRHDFDAVGISSPELEALHREKLLQEVRSDHHKDLIGEAMPAHRAWVPQFLNVFVQAYNTTKVKKEDLPKTYQDLLKPVFKGALGIEANDQEWLCGVIKQIGEDKTVRLFRELTATNGLSVRNGHSLLNNLVVSGEIPLGLTVYSFMTEQARKRGAPVDWFAIEPAIGRSNGVAVSKKAPHPHAALLFYEYLISDGQVLLAKMDFLPASKRMGSAMRGIRIAYLDAGAMLDDRARCDRLWDELIIKRQPR